MDMEERRPMSHVKAGLGIAGLVILISIITMFVGGNTAQPGSGFVTYLGIIGGLIIFINLYARANGNRVTFGELFSYGFKATAVYTIIFIGFLVLFSLLFPDFKNNAIEATRLQMETQKGVTERQGAESMAILEKYFWVFAIGGTTLFFVIVGAIGSLAGASLAKKNPQTPFDQSPS
jgi:NADH:ubiquinone oxidoreductase subunit 6 (subunit J)